MSYRYFFLRTIVIISCLLSLVPATAKTVAAENNYTASIGPEGGTISVFAIDPQTPSILYAGNDGGGLFKSVDGGSHWRALVGLSPTSIRSIAINPWNPSTLYVATYDGVLKSTDSGENWTNVRNGIPYDDFPQLVVLAPQTPSTLYAGSHNGVYKSTNSGANWAAVNTGLTDVDITALAVSPASASTVYAGTSSGVFKSTNGGDSWTAASSDLADLGIQTIVIDLKSPSTLYVLTYNGVFKSTDGGENWYKIDSGISDKSIYAFTMDPVNPSVLYALDYNNVYKSTNGGALWTILQTVSTVTGAATLAVDPETRSTLYLGTWFEGVLKSTDNGSHWEAMNNGLHATQISSIVINPLATSTIYVKTGGSIFKSMDRGLTWNIAYNGFGYGVRDMVINPLNPSVLYIAASDGSVYKSTDEGANWNSASNGISYNAHIYILAIDPQTPETLLAGTSQGVYKSTNGGADWALASSSLSNFWMYTLVIHPSTPATIYAGTDSGLFISSDGGGTWNAANNGLPAGTVRAIIIDPKTASILYAHVGLGLYKSTNGGLNWAPVETITAVQAAAIDPKTPSTLYLGSCQGTIYKSIDSGQSWSALNTDLPRSITNTIVVDPSSPSTLYIGTGGAGVFSIQQGVSTYSISGIIQNLSEAGISEVTVTANNGSTATSGSDGRYMLEGLPPGSYTLTPAKAGYTFVPESIQVTVANSLVTGKDFQALIVPTFVDVTISLHRDPPLEERQAYEDILGHFADAVYEMSNGVHKIRTVRIFTNGGNENDANIVWENEGWPRSYVSGYGHSGAHAYMADNWTIFEILGFPVTINMLAPDKRQIAGYSLAHEWSHYYYGLLDEYQGHDQSYNEYPYMPHTDDKGVIPSIMNDSSNGIQNPEWLNFSKPTVTENGAGKTAQDRMHSVSGWETLLRSEPGYSFQRQCFDVIFPRKYYPELQKGAPPAETWYSLPEFNTTPEGTGRSALDVTWESSGSGVASAQQAADEFNVYIDSVNGNVIQYPRPAAIIAKVGAGYPITGVSVTATYTGPDSTSHPLTFQDNGVAPDLIANDGLYSSIMPYTQNGDHAVTVSFDNHLNLGEYTPAGILHGRGPDGEFYIPSNQPVAQDFTESATIHLTVSEVQADDHGNTILDSTSLTVDNTSHYGQIDYAGDIDMFRITPDKNGIFSFRLTGLALGAHPAVHLRNENGDVTGLPIFIDPESPTYFYKFIRLQESLPHYIEISDQVDSASGGLYLLSIGLPLPNEKMDRVFLPLLVKQP